MAVPVRFILKEDLQHQQKKCGNRKGLERNHVGWGDDVSRSASGTLHAQKLQLNQNQKSALLYRALSAPLVQDSDILFCN